VFHFIGYVPINGNLYELDGLQKGPILLGDYNRSCHRRIGWLIRLVIVSIGDCTLDNWLDKVRPVIQARIAKYQSKEIRFALMAVVQNRMDVYKNRLAAIDKRTVRLNSKLTGGAAAATSGAMDTSDDETPLPANEADIKTELSVLEVGVTSIFSPFATLHADWHWIMNDEYRLKPNKLIYQSKMNKRNMVDGEQRIFVVNIIMFLSFLIYLRH
jgi:hypothetical protein